MNKEEFIKYLKEINIILTDKQIKELETYYNLLIEENKKYNLTTIVKEEDVYLKHFYDSLTIIKIIKLGNQSICDIGTGAGFPGLVLKIVFPNIKLTLIEATAKKCDFLKLVIRELKLDNVIVINDRIENYSKINREKYDIVICRAVAKLKILLEIAIPLVKVGGLFIPLKGKLEEEKDNLSEYLNELKIKIIEEQQFFLPKEESRRTLILFQKKESTNKIYPRRYNEIIKKEL